MACLEAKANVCCVKFNPESRYHLSFGSAGVDWRVLKKIFFVCLFFLVLAVIISFSTQALI